MHASFLSTGDVPKMVYGGLGCRIPKINIPISYEKQSVAQPHVRVELEKIFAEHLFHNLAFTLHTTRIDVNFNEISKTTDII